MKTLTKLYYNVCRQKEKACNMALYRLVRAKINEG